VGSSCGCLAADRRLLVIDSHRYAWDGLNHGELRRHRNQAWDHTAVVAAAAARSAELERRRTRDVVRMCAAAAAAVVEAEGRCCLEGQVLYRRLWVPVAEEDNDGDIEGSACAAVATGQLENHFVKGPQNVLPGSMVRSDGAECALGLVVPIRHVGIRGIEERQVLDDRTAKQC